MDPSASLTWSYDEYPRIEEEFQAYLDASLDPRGPESLFDVVAGLGVPAGGVALDVGCGEGDEAIELARRFRLAVHGVDPVARNIELATMAAEAEGLTASLHFNVGTAEDLPVPDGSVDLVWCKEVMVFLDLDGAFAELARVLRRGGSGLAYQVITGPRMTDEEARRFWTGDLGYGDARSVRPADVEAAIAGAGLELVERVDFTSEWGEAAQERSGAGGRRLLHAARLLREPQRYIDRFGEANYRIRLNDCLWHVYRMIGNARREWPSCSPTPAPQPVPIERAPSAETGDGGRFEGDCPGHSVVAGEHPVEVVPEIEHRPSVADAPLQPEGGNRGTDGIMMACPACESAPPSTPTCSPRPANCGEGSETLLSSMKPSSPSTPSTAASSWTTATRLTRTTPSTILTNGEIWRRSATPQPPRDRLRQARRGLVVRASRDRPSSRRGALP